MTIMSKLEFLCKSRGMWERVYTLATRPLRGYAGYKFKIGGGGHERCRKYRELGIVLTTCKHVWIDLEVKVG